MSDVKSVLVSGVGGQGTILVSRIITNGMIKAGYDVKQSEVHGMAQRGGSVYTQVRWGETVYGPVFGKKQADVLIAFEGMEAVRYADFLKPDGVAVINDYKQDSILTASGLGEYPEGCVDAMKKQFNTIAIDAMAVANELGNPKCVNVVMFGAACDSLGEDDIDWEEIVKETVPEKVRDLNVEAFRRGRELAKA